MTTNRTPEVLVVGGGIAALELVLALRDLAEDRVRMTMVAPEADFVPRPMLVAEPLGAAARRRLSLQAIGDDVGFRFVQAEVASVSAERRRVVLGGGGALGYDVLALAPGARRLPAFDDVIHIGDREGARELERLRQDIERGDVRSVAFVAPTLTGWLLPLYEAALITARIDAAVRVSLITSEEQPLALFGAEASRTVAHALDAAGVRFVGGRQAAVSGGAIVLRGSPPETIPADRIVSLPLVRGPRIAGVPESGVYGLIRVDSHGRVHGLPDTYAAGDATEFPIKHGGIACQQADAVAAHIASTHGAAVSADPFRPALRATLITGAGAPIELGHGTQEPPPGKLPGRYLAPYLTAALQAPPRAAV